MKKLSPLAALLVLSFLTWHSARSGYAARIIPKVLSANDLGPVSKAAQLTPNDPHAQVLLGALLEANDDRTAAIAHYQTAVALRPDDYVLRMQLARAQELEGEATAAIATATVAVSLAPFYAQPHWQLGNILVRAGRTDEGFAELRLAGRSDPALLPAIVDLAWQVSGGDVELVKRAVAPQTPAGYLALGGYLQKHGQVSAAVDLLIAAGNDPEAKAARKQHVSELVNAKEFRAAYQLWAVDPGANADKAIDQILDPGFEVESDLSEPFGWRAVDSVKGISLSVDSVEPKVGWRSLRVDFAGATNSGGEIISQLVLVEPKAHYKLHYYFRTESLVSGGLPFVVAIDARTGAVLQPVAALPPTTNGWRDAEIEFNTGDATTAIQISLRRQTCDTPQCPIFGKLWLDDFLLMGPGFVGEG
jgi:hypothetical protein